MSILTSIFVSVALAGGCPWGESPRQVKAFWKTVTIDGMDYSTSSLEYTLRECGEIDAADSLEKWQTMRKATLITGGVGLCLLWPVILATPVTGVLGVRAREQMEEEILIN